MLWGPPLLAPCALIRDAAGFTDSHEAIRAVLIRRGKLSMSKPANTSVRLPPPVR
jgi:hypothetical protein